jgi:hypothetical protein
MSMMHQGHQDGTDRRRQRVTNALKAAARNGSPSPAEHPGDRRSEGRIIPWA